MKGPITSNASQAISQVLGCADFKVQYCKAAEIPEIVRTAINKLQADLAHQKSSCGYSDRLKTKHTYKMVIALDGRKFKMMHRIKFQSLIRVHHVYNNIWRPYMGETLIAHPDERAEAMEYDKHTIGSYKNDDCYKKLFGHAPIEQSSLFYHFLQSNTDNLVRFEVLGKSKSEVGLVVTAKCDAYTQSKRKSMVLGGRAFQKKTVV